MIQKIPDQIVSMIAAGEVIQSPTTLLKECIENSLDAKATTIKVSINKKENQIEISDNGTGINQSDLKYLTKRHYTSKLLINKSIKSSTIEELFNLNTFGFRGEALCSISLLSNLEVKTKFENDKLGVHAVFKGEELIENSIVPIPMNNSGTVVIIKDLFYNLKDKAILNIKQIFNLINSFKMFHLETDFELIVDNKSIITPNRLSNILKNNNVLDILKNNNTLNILKDKVTNISKNNNLNILKDKVTNISKGNNLNISKNNNILEDKIKNQKILLATNYLKSNIKDLKTYKSDSYYFIFNNSINSKSTLKNDLYSFNNIFICFVNKRLVLFKKLQERIKEIYLFKTKVKRSFIFYIEISLDSNKVDVNIHPSKQEVLLENEEEFIEEICLNLDKSLSEVDSCEFQIIKGPKNEPQNPFKKVYDNSFKKVYELPSQKPLNFLRKTEEPKTLEISFENLIENKENWEVIKSKRKIIKFTSLKEIREEYKLNYLEFKDINYKLNTLIYVGKDENKLFFQHESNLICMNFKGILHKFLLFYFLNEFANYDSITLNTEIEFNKELEFKDIQVKGNNEIFLALIHEYFKVKIEINKNGLKVLEMPICQFLKPENNDFNCFFNEFTLNRDFLKEFIKKLILIEMINEKDCFLKILNLFVDYFSIQIINDLKIYKENINLNNPCKIFNPEILQKTSVENYLIMRIAKLKPNISFDEYFENLTDLKKLYNSFGR